MSDGHGSVAFVGNKITTHGVSLSAQVVEFAFAVFVLEFIHGTFDLFVAVS